MFPCEASVEWGVAGRPAVTHQLVHAGVREGSRSEEVGATPQRTSGGAPEKSRNTSRRTIMNTITDSLRDTTQRYSIV